MAFVKTEKLPGTRQGLSSECVPGVARSCAEAITRDAGGISGHGGGRPPGPEEGTDLRSTQLSACTWVLLRFPLGTT